MPDQNRKTSGTVKSKVKRAYDALVRRGNYRGSERARTYDEDEQISDAPVSVEPDGLHAALRGRG